MKRFLIHLTVLTALLTTCFILSASATATDEVVRAGLYYGSNALATANLENSTDSSAKGYRFGYFENGNRFVELGQTSEVQISMMKTQNIYLKSDLSYGTDGSGSTGVVGCYHIQLPQTYHSFSEAQSAASQYAGGFPAWISGQYYARVGAYADKASADAAMATLGLSGTVVGTSSFGISVTKSKTTQILFQFDSGGEQMFAVNPGVSDSGKPITWFKGYKYYGAFTYERIGGGNLTVVNQLSMDDYVKGILPYEMSASWPLEALKAQAVCARSYTLSATGSKHKAYHFDICNTTDCQVYRGLNQATESSNRAVDETSGVYAYSGGKVAQTFYYASNGGASEDVNNVWGSDLPYLKGVKDIYEETVAKSISNYYWTKTFTRAELTSKLQSKGYKCGPIVDFRITQTTPMGNVYSIAFTDEAGKTYTFSKEKVRTTLSLPSARYSLSGSGSSVAGSTGAFYVDGSETSLPQLDDVWAIEGSGSKSKLGSSTGLYAITSEGTQPLTSNGGGSSGGSGGNSFTIKGSGNGHSVGMSQWGANAMAKAGKTYDEILKFYFTGIELK